MKRLIEKTVFSGFVTCWRFAGAPTSRWPSFVNATTDGVVRPPSAFGITVGSPPSITAMHEFVVPRSIPITLCHAVSPSRSIRCTRIKSKSERSKLAAVSVQRAMAIPRVAGYASPPRRPLRGRPAGLAGARPRSPLARPLVEEVVAAIARRGAYALPGSRSHASSRGWEGGARGAHREGPGHRAHELDNADCFVVIVAPGEHPRGSDIPAERACSDRQAYRPTPSRSSRREKPVGRLPVPTPALAQDAGMTLRGVRGLPLRRRAGRLGRARARRWSGSRSASTPERGADRRRRHRPHLQPRGPRRPRGRDRREHAGRRGLLQPGRGLGEGMVAFSEYPACYGGRDVESVRLRFEAAAPSTRRRRPNEDFLVRRSTPTTAPACSASSASAATPASSGTCEHALRREDRGHGPPGARQRLPRSSAART